MGHEASGTVHALGTSVTTLKIGDHVALEPGIPCRHCTVCKGGKYNFCSQMAFAASPPTTNNNTTTHGALTKFFKIPEDFCYKLPDWMGLDEGVLVEPLAVAAHVLRLADVKAGQDVVVFGAGTIGLLCAAVAKAMGAAKVISVDVNEPRLDFAKKFHSTGVFLPNRGNSAEETALLIKDEFSLGDGAHAVIEATGVEVCIEAGIYVLRLGGNFVQAGLGNAKIQFPIGALSEKEIHMKGSFRYNTGDYDLAMHFLKSRRISVKDLITHVESFERATDAWERTKRGEGIKTLIEGPKD